MTNQTDQNRQFLTTLANLGIATHRLDRIRDAARLHRQQLLGTSGLYAVIEADDEPEQCPRSEFDGYGLQCQKPAGHNLCTFEEQPAAVSAAVAPPTNQAALRDRIADALYRHEWPRKQVWEQALAMDREVFEAMADAVLAVLPERTSRAAVLTEPERKMLAFALEITQEEIHARSLDLADDDKAALVSLRRMADETATETPTLVHVGWWCWRGGNHGHLATMACRSDNVPIHVPAEWQDDMRAVIQRLEDEDDDPAAGARQDGAES